ncbi:MAG: CheR family methyltransferase [Acidimicrobiales bacterium]
MPIATEQFRFVQQLVLQRSAIVLSDDKEYLVDSRLTALARTLGLSDANGMVDQCRTRRDANLERRVVEAMTTNETSWFRDIKPWDLLKRHIIPDLIKRNARTRQLRIWSAACSSGQELYTVAVMLDESFPELRLGWQVELLGTDLNTEMVRLATEGRFTALEINRGLPASLLVRHFHQEGGAWRANDALRNRARFIKLNLVEPWPALPNFDLVLLRNVLIYFDSSTKRQVLDRTVKQMAPDGCLLLGATEIPTGLCDDLVPVRVDNSIFYRSKRG